jgi:hypothetical protein
MASDSSPRGNDRVALLATQDCGADRAEDLGQDINQGTTLRY